MPKSKKLLENEADLPGSETDPDMKAAEDDLPLSDIPAAVAPDVPVSDEDASNAMTDVMGGSGDARFRSKCILARFAQEGWRIVKGT